MNLVFLDFETYYSDDYSLKRMSPAEYILNPRFQVNGIAIKEGMQGEPFWLDGGNSGNIGDYLRGLNPETTMTISHNALFDSSILSWRYGFVPKLMCCTLSVAQATIRYRLKSLSLDAVAKDLKIGTKESSALMNVKGMDLSMVKAAGLYEAYKNYAIADVEMCAGIFKTLVVSGMFPLCELPILDMILRMTVQPSFVLDRNILAQHLSSVVAAKSRALDTIGSDTKSVRQDETFAGMLRAQCVDPPRKISPTTGLERYAFAKTDAEFLELEEHENPVVQALVAARLGAKSTIEETRAQRFINISNLSWPITLRGNMPMPVRFSGAHTHRGSGDWKLNVQNMTRGGALRKALRAPPGFKVMTVDSSQIEARLVAFLCGQKDLLQYFEDNQDVYSVFASSIFKKPITKENKTERYVGKQAILGLGFGLGPTKFQARLKTDSKNQTGQMINLTDTEAADIVSLYREKFIAIPNTWKLLTNKGIPALTGMGESVQFGPVVIEKETISMPGRLKMFYHGMSFGRDMSDGWSFTYQGKIKRIYGGKLLENIVQYLDRILVFDAAARIQQRLTHFDMGYHLAQQAHDENGYVIREDHVDEVRTILMQEMTRRPSWGAKLPLMAEVGVGDSYGDAK